MIDTLAARVDRACRLTGSFRLRSGQVASTYFDKYLFEADPVLLRDVAMAMAELLPETDVLAGLELGGIPLVTLLSQLTGLPACFVRKEAKAYGTAKLAEGASVGGRRVALIEDVVTTAGALREALPRLRAAGASIEVAVCAIDREQGGAAALTALGVELRAALTRTELEVG